MANRLSKIQSIYKIYTAKLAGGDYYWDIYNPNYGQVDNSFGTASFTGRKFHVEPAIDKNSEDKYREAEFFLVCGDATTLQQGSVLIETTSTDFPILTVTQVPEVNDFLAIKTPKIGQILNEGVPIYTSVYFDYSINIRSGYDDYKNIPTAMSLPEKRAIIYKRPGIVEDMVFQDLTPGVGANDIWLISLIEYRENFCVLNLKKPDRT